MTISDSMIKVPKYVIVIASAAKAIANIQYTLKRHRLLRMILLLNRILIWIILVKKRAWETKSQC